MTAESTRSGQPAGSPIGVMPPYSMPVSPTAVSIGANDALRAPSCLRTAPFSNSRRTEACWVCQRTGGSDTAIAAG